MRIVVNGLSKTYRTSRGAPVRAVDDVSLQVDDSELLTLLGPSGSGKTTLLRCVAGLETADAGEIVIDGRLVFSSARNVFVPPERRRIGMVFQSYALWPHLTTFDNVAYPLRARRTSTVEIQDRVQRALKLVGCDALGQRHPGELSGGQQQRVAVARAIVCDNAVLLFDEPLSSVDALVREELRRELRALQRELGFSALYITHDQIEALAVGDRMAVLVDGRLAQIGPPRQVYRRPETARVAEFLGVTNRLPGEVVAHESGTTLVATALGPLRAAGTRFAPGAAVLAVFRPEQCRLVPAGPNSGPALVDGWPAEVEQELFLGTTIEYRLRCGEQFLIARTSDSYEPGASVAVSVPPRYVHLMSAA